MAELSILGAIARLGEMTIAVKVAEHEAMKRAALIVQTEAKKEIGEYQPEAQPFAAWAELKDATKDERVRLGFTENDPLLRTGVLRDSIDMAVSEPGARETEGVVGSNNPIAEYQELGTARIPPRSFLGGAAVRKTPEVVEALGGGVVGALVGRGVVNGALGIIGKS